MAKKKDGTIQDLRDEILRLKGELANSESNAGAFNKMRQEELDRLGESHLSELEAQCDATQEALEEIHHMNAVSTAYLQGSQRATRDILSELIAAITGNNNARRATPGNPIEAIVASRMAKMFGGDPLDDIDHNDYADMADDDMFR